MYEVLCFGDSNTWGYDPVSKQRFPNGVRWTGVLQAELGPGFRVIEEGLNGRTTVWEDPVEGDKMGKRHLMPCLESLSPTGAEGAFGLDRVWNDDRYYLGMANAGAAQYADCIGIHYNEGIIPPSQTTGDPRGDYPTYYFSSMMQRALGPFSSSNLPLCFTELGYLSGEGFNQAIPAGFAWANSTTVANQAQWLASAVQIAASTGKVKMLVVFNVDFTQFVDNDPQGGYAIIRPDGSCPACQSLAALMPAS